jgi:hypothetical protein
MITITIGENDNSDSPIIIGYSVSRTFRFTSSEIALRNVVL